MSLKTDFLDWHIEPAEETIEQDCKKLIEITKKHSILFLEWVDKNYVKVVNTYTQKNRPYWDCDNYTLDYLFDKFISENKKSRCCGRCDGVNDICHADRICENHTEIGCEICFGER